MPKPIVFDKSTFFKNLNNWVLVENDFNGLEYSNDEGSCYYEFQMLWSVNGEEISTWVEVTHRWVEDVDEGDYWTPPSSEIIHEDIEVYVTQIWDGESNEYDLEEYNDLCNRLSFLIHDMLF